jgi:hypothetical protein
MLDTHQLICQEQDSLQVELAVAEIEEILKRWAKTFKDQDIVVAFHSKPMYSWNANAAGKILVHLVLVLNLRMLHLNSLKFNCDVLF